MKLSVLTPCYNAAQTIAFTIESFLAQQHGNKEMIILDGGSIDDTPQIVERYASECVRFISAPDKGMYDALNKGLELYGGDAVGVLNADDCFHDEQVLTHIAEGLSSAQIVHGHLDFVRDHQRKQIVRRWRAEPRPSNGFRSGWMPAHPTFYVRREVAEKVGLFDLSLATAADYDWMIRALELHGFRSTVVDHVMVDMAQGGRSTAGLGAHIRHNLEALRARRKWLGSGPVDYALLAKPLRKLGQFIAPAHRSRSA